jgi:hypothetical protein
MKPPDLSGAVGGLNAIDVHPAPDKSGGFME